MKPRQPLGYEQNPSVASLRLLGLPICSGIRAGLLRNQWRFQRNTQLVLALALVALAGPSVIMLWFAIAFSSIPRYARMVRSGVLTQKALDYVDAARAIGQSPMRIMFRQILPNIMSPIAVQLTRDFARAISVEAALSYLGLGLSVPYISWGTMIRDAQDFLEVAPWLAIFPGLALLGVILAFTLVGDALRDRMDPRMRTSLSRRLV